MDCIADLQKIFFEYKEKRDKFSKEDLSKELVELKKKNIEKSEELLETAMSNLKAHGCDVYFAKDKTEVEDIFKKLLAANKKVVKSKSSAAKEVYLNEWMEKHNIDFKETDLGDWLSDTCKIDEIHPVLPAVELSPEFIVGKIKEKYGVELAATAQGIAQFAKKEIETEIAAAEIGITGANAVTASGEIIILENEGNISKVSRLPEHHIVITGMEKIVENMSEAMHVV